MMSNYKMMAAKGKIGCREEYLVKFAWWIRSGESKEGECGRGTIINGVCSRCRGMRKFTWNITKPGHSSTCEG